MAVNDRITELVLKAQERIFRLAARDHALSLNAISLESGIPYNTIRSYAGHNGTQAMMPVAAVCKLAGVIPDNLLGQLFQPVGRCLVQIDENSDHDSYAANCLDFAGEYQRSRHPASPAGVDIAPCEDAVLKAKRTTLRSVA